jgi:hypothetical protein
MVLAAYQENRMSTTSIAGLPRITSGVDFVNRFEPNVLLNGLISGERAHHLLLEVVRRIAQDRPSDAEAAFDRLHDLQSFLNNTTTVPAMDPRDLVVAFDAAKAAVTAAEPWHGPSRWMGGHRINTSKRAPRTTDVVHSGND